MNFISVIIAYIERKNTFAIREVKKLTLVYLFVIQKFYERFKFPSKELLLAIKKKNICD